LLIYLFFAGIIQLISMISNNKLGEAAS